MKSILFPKTITPLMPFNIFAWTRAEINFFKIILTTLHYQIFGVERIKCIILIFAGFFFAFTSCKKSGTAIPIQQTLPTSISLKFSGSLYITPNAVAIYYKSTDAMAIGGQFGSNSIVNLVITNVKAGTFDLSSGNASLSFSNGANGSDTFVSTSGSMIVTEFSSTTIAGTFEFSGTDSSNVTRPITEGQFTIGYSTQ